MASTSDFKNGLVLQIEGQLWTIIEFQHVKPGKGPAFVRTKLKNVLSGKVVDKTFNAGVKVETATVDRRDMTYLYHDGSDYIFMDGDTYDQISINEATVGDGARFMLENMAVQVAVHEDVPLSSSCPSRWSSRSSTPIRVCRATARPVAPSPPPSRPVPKSRCRCSSTLATS